MLQEKSSPFNSLNLQSFANPKKQSIGQLYRKQNALYIIAGMLPDRKNASGEYKYELEDSIFWGE